VDTIQLINVQVENYKSISDSGSVGIDNVTCLVGKNESGKTAFLQALNKLNPVDKSNANYDSIMDYPRKDYSKYKKRHETDPDNVVTAVFELLDDEVKCIESELGEGVLEEKIVRIFKGYDNVRRYDFTVNESVLVKTLLDNSAIPESLKDDVVDMDSFASLIEFKNSTEGSQITFSSIISDIESESNGTIKSYIWSHYISNYFPKFVYFDDYCIMHGKNSIQNLKKLDANDELDESARSFLSLLSIAGTGLDEFDDAGNYERIKAELESASNSITEEVFEYWSQNKSLEVEFDISPANPHDAPPLNEGTILHLRIKNNRHKVSVTFDERSKGFVWFFSFLSYFSQIEEEMDTNLILLLDEPGLSLHAKAQNDFLRFIDDKVSSKHQVLYSTHSPFMIDPNHLEFVRTVQDVDGKGTIVSQDSLKNDADTVFPLQAALGYEIAQTLFIGPNCLLVEGPSDLIYLQLLSQLCVDESLSGLDDNWVIVPVGGADKLSTFVSLLGSNQLNIVVLIDISGKDQQRISNLIANSHLKHDNLITIGDITESKNADLEDIFEPDFYLRLVNGAYEGELESNLSLEMLKNQNPRIIKRVESYFKDNDIAGGHFNHYKPAVYLLKEQNELFEHIDDSTKDRLNRLFDKVNSLIDQSS
jgi:predicted ATP-dependent endonuclease of OLD family